jgi:hypothetical protein
MKIVFYIPYFNNIGGVESWIYYIARLYGDGRDITVYYVNGDENQLDRLRPFVKVRRFYHQRIDCDLAIFCAWLPDDEIRCFQAETRIQFIHACYSVAYDVKKYIINPLINKYIAVSQTAADDFYNLTGYMPDVIRNPIALNEPKKVLKLISATRITEDKGSIWEKMQIFAKKLLKANIPFIWLVFTNSTIRPNIKGIIFMPPELDISHYMKEADYLVQFSKTEADCLSIKESLSVGTPVLVTNFASVYENKIVDGKNGYIFDMNMEDIDVEKVYNIIPKFEYTPNSSDKEWKNLLGPKRNLPKDRVVKVRCVFKDGFTDLDSGKKRKYNETWEIPISRALELEDFKDPNTLTNYHLIDIIE